MVSTNSGSGYRYDPKASGVSSYDSASGKWVDRNSSAGQKMARDKASATAAKTAALTAQRQKQAAAWATNTNNAELAAVKTQETQDLIAENKARNASINALAMQQAQGGNGAQLGRSTFQRKQGGVSPNQAVSDLNSANAANLADARKAQLAAEQQANPLRNEQKLLGYTSALAPAYSTLIGLQQQSLQNRRLAQGLT